MCYTCLCWEADGLQKGGQFHLTRIPKQDVNKALAYRRPARGFQDCGHIPHMLTQFTRSHGLFTVTLQTRSQPGPGDNHLFSVHPVCGGTKYTRAAHFNGSVQQCTFQEGPSMFYG